MITLKSEKGEIHNLFTRSKHVVGRNGNLELEGDKSVSRQHAVIHVTIKGKQPQILLQDLGSKYGTYVNEGIQAAKEIAKNTPTRLKIGDRIRFGQQWNTWTVEKSQFVVCTSTLTQQDKASVRSILTPMKGVLVSDWTENCTHLMMNNIKITIKVVCALGSVKPIVSLDYWQTLADVMNSTEEEALPDCDDFVPPLAEPSLMNVPTNFKMNNTRRRLFRETKFVACTTSQYNGVLPMVTNAGGTVIDGTRNAITEEQYKNEKILVLGSTTVNKRNRNLSQLLKCVEKNQHRCIAESEIGLSLIFCSMDKHCNPTSDVVFIQMQPESQITIKDEESILDLETQDLGDENCTQFFDDDSSKFSLAVNERRTFSDSDDEQRISDTQPPPRAQPVIEKPTAKRKLQDSTDKPNLKSSKLDSWVIREKPATRSNTSSVQAPSHSVSGVQKTKSLFAFPRDKNPTERSSDSLFKSSSSSSGADMLESSVIQNKRKRSSIESIECTPVPLKKPHSEKKGLFQLPSTSKEQKSRASLILFDSNDSMDSFSDKTAKLNITNQPEPKPKAIHTPIVVPRNISLSQFVDAPSNKSNGEMKEELADMTTEVKEVFDKTVVHTLPLIKSNKSNNQPCSARGSVVNFKKFKKNNGLNHTCMISANDLFLFKSKAAPISDVHMVADSDSS